MNSIIPGNSKDICYECRRYCNTEEHHIFEGNSKRYESEHFGLKVNLCRQCHEFIHSSKGDQMRDEFHKMAQTEFEEAQIRDGLSADDARNLFRKHFIKSYL